MIEVSARKTVTVFSIKGAPRVISSLGPEFEPYKAEITDFGNRGKVQLFGRNYGRLVPGSTSATFKLYGYEQYRPVPQWLFELLREVGYYGMVDTCVPKQGVKVVR